MIFLREVKLLIPQYKRTAHDFKENISFVSCLKFDLCNNFSSK